MMTSLKTRLAIALSAMAILPILLLGWVVYDTMLNAIKSERLEMVGRVADAKHEQLRMVLTRANSRAQQFLSDLSRQCDGNNRPLNKDCATGLIKAYLFAEGALGISLYGERDNLTIGIPPAPQTDRTVFREGQLAAFNRLGQGGDHAYFITAESAGYRLEVNYPISTLIAVFIPHPFALGLSGETFLADGEGYFATPARYPTKQGNAIPIAAHPMQTCLTEHSHEMLDLDYRDVPIIHGFRFIPEFGSACIMAHISQAEAFAPLRLLQQRLIIGLLMTVLLLLLASVYIAKRIVRPIVKLTQVVRTFSAGDYTALAEVEGRDEISELSSTFNEMTQRLNDTQQHLVQDKSRLSATIENAMDAVVQMDAQGVIIGWTKQAEAIFGWLREESMGRLLHETIIPLRYREAHLRGLQHFLRSGEGSVLNSRIEVSGLHRRGHEFPMELSIAAIKVGDGYEFSAFIRDITDRKKADDDLRIAAVAFESQESLVITDASGVILHVNQACVDETGYTPEELIGQTPSLLRSDRHPPAFYRAMWDAIDNTGKWQGEVWDKRKNGEIYPKWLTISAVKGSNGVVSHYVGSHTDITERKAAEEQIQYLAFYDYLTSLPNRRLLMDRLRQALVSNLRTDRKGALLFIDLDNFKVLNDLFGHHIGDLLLQQVARRLEVAVRESDTVARLGGDEFVVILDGLSGSTIEAAEQTEMIGEKILAALNQPYQLGAMDYRSTPSIGITLFGEQKDSVDELLKQADIAMYQAKKAGRNTLRFFDAQMQEAVNHRATLEDELRNALEKNQFQLYYQIQVNGDGQPLGAETLIRWIHPERGMVSPIQFIPLAEETGLIVLIGQWVLENACAQIKAWEKSPLTRELVLAVNVSAKQFNQLNFVAQVQATVQQHQIDPSKLKLELTESMLVSNIDDIILSMQALKKIGVQFSLDDFGTGYSSLQYLQQLPLDQLKIDQSFVRNLSIDLNGNAIVRAIIAIAKGMNLHLIAEGVETPAQRQLLHELGCDHYQGYLFGKPVPIAQFEAGLGK